MSKHDPVHSNAGLECALMLLAQVNVLRASAAKHGSDVLNSGERCALANIGLVEKVLKCAAQCGAGSLRRLIACQNINETASVRDGVFMDSSA